MADYTVKSIDDMDAIFGGGFKRARSELGVTSFGLQVLDFPPHNDRHPEHDHSGDGQEEVYVVLRGELELDVEGERVPLEPGSMARVGPSARRKLRAGPQGARLLAIGGTPGQAFEAKDFTEVGAPDPAAG